MANESNLPGADILADTKAMIDGLKTVCANAGLANDSSEYKIITEAFLYKFLNDKFLHELRKLDSSRTLTTSRLIIPTRTKTTANSS